MSGREPRTAPVPVLHQLNERGEKTGAVHYFCSVGCRSQSHRIDPDHYNQEEHLPAYIPENVHCETCGQLILEVVDWPQPRPEPEPERHYIYPDGTPLPPSYCAMPDHYITEYVVRVRSTCPVGAHTIKELIRAQHEVVEINRTTETCVVRNTKHPS